jgi:two-component system, OmpR family, response regulator MprA
MGVGRVVLIVDDDASIRMLCRVNLELDGHRAVEAATIDEARAAVSAEPVDVIILDVHVGAGDGLELLSELRRDRPEMPVALLSGTADVDVVEGAGPDAVLGKPFELHELRSTVERLGGGRRSV